jgi:WD40 repeat protein
VVELSPDLQVSAAAEKDGTITLQRLRNKQGLIALPGFNQPVERLRFGPNESVLVADTCGPSQHQSVVWHWPTGKKLFAAAHGMAGNAIDFSADGRKLAVGRPNGAVTVYSLPHGEIVHELELKRDSGSPRTPQVIRFSPSGDLLAACSSDDHYVEIWSLETTQRLARPYHPGVVHDISWHPHGELLAAACGDSRIYLWHTNDFDNPNPKRLSGHEGRVGAVAFNHRGTLLASLGHDETVRLWIPETGRQMARRTGGEPVDRLQFSEQDHHLIATASGQTNARVWEVLGGELVVFTRRPAAATI